MRAFPTETLPDSLLAAHNKFPSMANLPGWARMGANWKPTENHRISKVGKDLKDQIQKMCVCLIG